MNATVDGLAGFCTAVLLTYGVDNPSASEASRVVMHGSIHGVDSHGVMLLHHYVQAFEGGRLNRAPQMRLDRVRAGHPKNGRSPFKWHSKLSLNGRMID